MRVHQEHEGWVGYSIGVKVTNAWLQLYPVNTYTNQKSLASQIISGFFCQNVSINFVFLNKGIQKSIKMRLEALFAVFAMPRYAYFY